MSQIPSRVRHILQINTRDHRGGAEGCAWNLFTAYRARGCKSWLAVGEKHSTDPDVWEIPHARYASTRWARTWLGFGESLSPLRQRGGRGIGRVQASLRQIAQPGAWYSERQGWEDFDYPGTAHLLSHLPYPPEVIHCHNLHPNYFDLRALIQLSQTRPVILHLHDAWLLSGHCAHSFDCERWQNGCGQCPYPHTYPAMRADNSAANWERKRTIYAQSRLYLVTVSQWLMDKVDRSMLSGIKKCVIPNGTDLSLFQPGFPRQTQADTKRAARHALGLPLDAEIILLIDHSIFKDYGTMEAALRQLKRKTNRKLLFICLGRRSPERPAGQGRMIYPGWITDAAQMVQYYRAADIYIHAAHDEAFGKTISEAGACGTPVVATAVGGIPEQVQNGETGFLVPPHDPQTMAHAVQMLLDDGDRCRRMGSAGAEHIAARFGLTEQVDAFLGWYEEVYADWWSHQERLSL